MGLASQTHGAFKLAETALNTYNKLMYSVDNIIAQLNNVTSEDKEMVRRAYTLASEAHKEQKRYSGEPYIEHVSAVGYKLAEMGMGPRTVTAGLLHDTIEDTDVTPQQIKEAFSEEILFLVSGVTKLSSVRYHGTDRHNESLRKLFIATSQDIRVLLIKLIDRLHNMETLEFVPKEKQLRIAQETLEVYVPVAHRLGMGKIRKELEDLAFPYVYPKEAARVEELKQERASKADELLEKERKILQKGLVDAGLLKFQTSFRVKGSYSLYHKLKRKEWNIETIYDLLAMRVVVQNVEDCYRALGIVHKIWRPLPGRMKDYIAFPKPNGYQSIHTTVMTRNGNILEIQIRTERMHHEAEFGVASHIIYKQSDIDGNTKSTRSRFFNLIPSLFYPFSRRQAEVETDMIEVDKAQPPKDRIPLWIKEIGQLYSSEKSTGAELIQDLQNDFFRNRIFVFTPNRDVVDLPTGATPIDFAYAIHSEIGNHISGVKVNKKMVALDTKLNNGDIVEVETKKSAKPSKKWLDIATTTLAKRHVRSYLGIPAPATVKK